METDKTLDAVFIADLHLTADNAACLELAEKFLTTVAPKAKKLFILGDLVEYWVGDDAYDGSLDRALAALASLPGLGTRCYLMHGNRDFLLGEDFARKFNCELITADTYSLRTHSSETGSDLLLMHGDTLCTDDTEYQRMRQLLRLDSWQKEFLALSPEERHTKAQQIRSQSVAETARKSDEICDVNQQAVIDEMKRHSVTRLLHGHTHRPDTHTLNIDGKPATRWVLGDWHDTGAVYAALEGETLELRHWLPADDRS